MNGHIEYSRSDAGASFLGQEIIGLKNQIRHCIIM